MVAEPNRMNGIMIDFALIVDLEKQTRPATQMMTRINVLDFHGNGNVVCLGGLKPQAASSKQQAPSVRQIDARQYTLLTQASSTKPQALMSGSGLLTPGPGAKPQAPSFKQSD